MNYFWYGLGKDNKGSIKNFKLTLSINLNTLNGEFKWKSEDGNVSEVEYVHGTEDSEKNFEIEAHSLNNVDKSFSRSYRGRFSDNYSGIEGTWEDFEVTGTFKGY